LASDRTGGIEPRRCPIYTRQRLTRPVPSSSLAAGQAESKQRERLCPPATRSWIATATSYLPRACAHKYLQGNSELSRRAELLVLCRQWRGRRWAGDGRRWTGGGRARGPARRTSSSSSTSGSAARGGGTPSPSSQVLHPHADLKSEFASSLLLVYNFLGDHRST
jgi:hypothetical protein